MVLDSQAPLPVQRYQDRGDLILFATKAPCDPEWKDDQLDASKGEYRPLKVNSLILGRIARSGTGSGYLSQICPLHPALSEEEVSSFKDNTSLSSVLRRLSSLYCADHPESELYLFLGTEAVLQELYVLIASISNGSSVSAETVVRSLLELSVSKADLIAHSSFLYELVTNHIESWQVRIAVVRAEQRALDVQYADRTRNLSKSLAQIQGNLSLAQGWLQ